MGSLSTGKSAQFNTLRYKDNQQSNISIKVHYQRSLKRVYFMEQNTQAKGFIGILLFIDAQSTKLIKFSAYKKVALCTYCINFINLKINKKNDLKLLLVTARNSCQDSRVISLQNAIYNLDNLKLLFKHKINIVIRLAYNGMGISISHSDNNHEIQMIRERKRLKRRQMIESQLQQSASDMRQGSALKENKERNTAPNFTPNHTLTKTSKPNHLQINNMGSMGQKKKQINRLKPMDQPEQALPKSSNNFGNHESIYQSKYVGQMKNTNDNDLKPLGKKIQQKVNQRASFQKEGQIRKDKKDNDRLREFATIDVRRNQTKTWKEGRDPEVEADKMKIQIQRVSFSQYDWTIPGQEEEKQNNRRKAMMPSMNFVLQNKFAENMGNYKLHNDDQQSAAKNRRKVMRELLTGKRNTGDEDFKILPNCNFRNLQVSRFCQQK